MTSKEFVIWLRGFSQGVHHYNITPAQWDYLKDKLAEVKDDNIPVKKNYINPYGNSYTSTSSVPYTTGGDDEFIKHHNED